MLANTSSRVSSKTASPIRVLMWRPRIPRRALRARGGGQQHPDCVVSRPEGCPLTYVSLVHNLVIGPGAQSLNLPGLGLNGRWTPAPLSVKRALPAPQLPSRRSFGAAAVANPAPLAARLAVDESSFCPAVLLGGPPRDPRAANRSSRRGASASPAPASDR